MAQLPETRNSLLLKVRDPADADAWIEFAAIYRPVIYRLARRRGLQDADAEDLAQRVLVSISAAIRTWEKDERRGTFRAWLLRIARNAIINALTRKPPDAAVGGTDVSEQLDAQGSENSAINELIEDEHRRAVFRWAAAEVRSEFHDATWMAFQLTAVDGLSIEVAAAELGKSTGSVYAARSRVMRRLKAKVLEFQNEEQSR
ncbi:MAG: sigma-70 family RNA polymerase sigma factor [Pirellulaceae bacterium]|jgi:RNA polymerase sigma-70 factor (ECF subfamily)|nr:RNA polymerase subunit sigma [Planctomycetaceae bacterium]MDP6719041.1 sigma-70 family RNA polymerase sigma factor [Pirellulaceae bacterium]